MSFFGDFFQFPGFQANPNMPRKNKPVNNAKYYNILGVPKTADDKTIRKAYLKKSIKGDYCHPDKGGTEEKFKVLAEAYEVLKDKNKRHIYDSQGESGLKNGHQGGINPFDMQNMFFGRQQQNQNTTIQKGKATVFNLKLSLEDLCRNTTKKIKITRRVIFNKLTNTQLPDHKIQESWTKCEACGGAGKVTKLRQIGPGFMQQSQSPCETCNHTGSIFNSNYEIREIQEIISIFVEKGSVNGDKIKFSHKGNATPGKIPGDLIVMVHEKKHNIFVRKNNDLLLKKNITLQEALFGYNFYLTHPDGRSLKIQNKSHTVVGPKTNLKCAEGCGMPIKEDSYRNGKLFICLEIIFPTPEELMDEKVNTAHLKNMFLAMTNYNMRVKQNRITHNLKELDEAENIFLNNVDLSQFGKKEKRHKNANESDSDEERMGFGGPTQCRQM